MQGWYLLLAVQLNICFCSTCETSARLRRVWASIRWRVEGRDGRWHSTRAAAARGRDHSQSHHYTQELTCHCDLYSDPFSRKARPDTLFFIVCCSSIGSKICNSTFEYCFQAWVELTQLELIGFSVTAYTSQFLKPKWQLRKLSMLPWK
jgi:hypothetical protein